MNQVVAEQIRNTVEARMRELESVLSEYAQLRGVLAVLDDPDAYRRLIERSALSNVSPISRGLDVAASDGTPNSRVAVAPMRRRADRLGSKPGADGRAPQGANKQRILAVIAEYPGIAAPEIAKLTGLKRPVVASTISRLKRTGELSAHGQGVCLAESPSQRVALPSLADSLTAHAV